MLKNKSKQVSAQIPHSDCLYLAHVTDNAPALWISKGNIQNRITEMEAKSYCRL